MSVEKNNPAFGAGQDPTQQPNPNYYGDEASVADGPPPPEYSDPTSAHPDQQQQQYYPPPPPGPPPNQNAPNQSGHPLQSHPVHAQAAAAPPPSYESHGGPGPSASYGDEKAPNLPPRPASGHANVPYFPPPPGQEENQDAGADTARPEQYYAQGSGGAAAVPPPPPPPAAAAAAPYTPGTGQYALGSQSAAIGGFAAAAGSPAASAAAAANTSMGAGAAGAAAAAAAGSPTAGPSTSAAADGKAEKKKTGFGERLYQWGVKAGVPVNKLTNKLGSEAFWPTTMDKECDKAARILRSFCKDGFYTTPSGHPPPSPGHPSTPGPKGEAKTLVKIPTAAVQRARGLAIFTTFRTGFHFSGAGGSGVVVSRLPDGSWSPPVGFLVHTLGAGFMVGLDVYDSVCVLNTDEAVRAFTKPRLSLGGEIAVVAGPVGAGKSLDAAIGAGKPVWSYMKSRGFYAGIQADGTVIIQRPAANAAFYGDSDITPERILKGDVPASPAPAAPPKDGAAGDGLVMWPAGGRQLIEVLKSAEGKKADENIVGEVGAGPTPGDLATTEGVPHEPSKEAEMQGGTTRYA